LQIFVAVFDTIEQSIHIDAFGFLGAVYISTNNLGQINDSEAVKTMSIKQLEWQIRKVKKVTFCFMSTNTLLVECLPREQEKHEAKLPEQQSKLLEQQLSSLKPNLSTDRSTICRPQADDQTPRKVKEDTSRDSSRTMENGQHIGRLL